jgi:hypothetical protein
MQDERWDRRKECSSSLVITPVEEVATSYGRLAE